MRSRMNAWSVVGSLALASTAYGTFTGVGATLRPFTSTGGASYDVFELYATFDSAGDSCQAVAVGGIPTFVQTLDSGGGGFFQVTIFGAHQNLPNNEAASVVPNLEADSFLTIGTRQFFSGTPTLATIDGYNVSDFNNGSSTVVDTNGGWFVVPTEEETYAVPFPPPLPPGASVFTPPGATHGVIMGQFTVNAGNVFSGDLGVVLIVEDGMSRQISNQDPAGINTVFAFASGGEGACCLVDGACSSGPQADCVAVDGIYQGDGVTCFMANCPQPGACCFDDGTCTFGFQDACEAEGGGFQGEGVDCSDVTCAVSGACCFDDGLCTFGLQSACKNAGGAFQGGGVSCATGSCPQTGACCLFDGSCTVGFEVDCDTSGGAYQADGTTCAPNPCPPATGACCNTGGVCFVITETVCDDGLGIYQGDGTACDPSPCPPYGACCLGPSLCLQRFESDCLKGGGTFLGQGTDCSPDACSTIGACCLPSGSCTFTMEDGCADIGGVYEGAGTVCAPSPCPAPTGACNLPNGACEILSAAACAAAGGTYLGDDTTCIAGIPTVSEWGLIVLALLLVTGATIVLPRTGRVACSVAGDASGFRGDGPSSLIVPRLFAQTLAATLVIAVAGLVGAALVIRSVAAVDVAGTLLCTPIVAYVVHLWMSPTPP